MRIYIVIAIFFSVTTIILSQENSSCGTKVPLGISPEQVKSNNLHLFENTNTYNLRLAIHIVYSQNGNDSITNENLYYKLQKLNYYMEQAGFSFYEYNRDYIESDYFANFSEEKTDSLFSTFNIDGCINVYFVPVFAYNGWSSFSYRFGVSPQGIVVINSAHETTLPHEMGHYFDLLHTHHIWIIEEIPGVLDSLYENIDRVGNCKNCDFTGDLLCDTPADPSLRMRGSLVNDSCTWNPSNIPPFDECNNNNYAPLTDNLMTTELPRICRSNFTSSQIQRMRQTLIEYRGELLKNLVYLENSIDGSNAGGNLHIDYNNFPSGSTAIVDSGNHIIGTYNERFNNNNLYKHNSWNQFSQDYYLKRTVYIENNVEQIANFSKLESVTVRNKIDGMNFNDGLNIRFNDPWYLKDQYENQSGMNDFIPFTSPYFPTGAYNQSSGGVFLNQEIAPNKPYYSVKADYLQTFNLSQTGRTHKFYFQGWSRNFDNATNQPKAIFEDSLALQTAVVFLDQGAVVSANYKGTQLSNNSLAYSKGSQRKFIRLYNGDLFSVYESMNRIWLERSTNNGQSWIITNQGRPLLDRDSKNPAICEYGGTILIVSEEVGWINIQQYNPDIDAVFNRCSLYVCNLNFTANPVISYSFSQFGSNRIMVVFESKTGEFCGDYGLYYAIINPENWNLSSEVKIDNTDFYSKNPTLDSYIHSNGGTRYYHLAWEQSGDIRYCKLLEDEQGNIAQSSTEDISRGSSFMFHSSPSIIAIGTGARVCWLGYQDEAPPNATVVFRDPENDRFWTFGTNASAPSINKSNDNSYYAFAWSERGNTIKFVDNQLREVYQINGINGRDVQLSNGNGSTGMNANIFNANAEPYFFTMSNNLNYYSVPSGDEIIADRSGVVRKNEGEIYFAVGDIKKSNGDEIGFKDAPINLVIDNTPKLNQYLESKPFVISDNSGFEYTVEYGITDTSKIRSMFTGNEQVRFKVELVDNNTGEIIGVYDDVVYSKEYLEKYENISYVVNTTGIGERTVKLRLRVEESVNPQLSMVDKVGSENVLAKRKTKEIHYQGSNKVESYALHQNYPNPFNPSTTISWQSPVGGRQTLKVFDILGREVATLVDEYREAGYHTIKFDASYLSSGVYYYQLKINEYVSVKKMMLMK